MQSRAQPWDDSIAGRIPSELAKAQGLKPAPIKFSVVKRKPNSASLTSPKKHTYTLAELSAGVNTHPIHREEDSCPSHLPMGWETWGWQLYRAA